MWAGVILLVSAGMSDKSAFFRPSGTEYPTMTKPRKDNWLVWIMTQPITLRWKYLRWFVGALPVLLFFIVWQVRAASPQYAMQRLIEAMRSGDDRRVRQLCTPKAYTELQLMLGHKVSVHDNLPAPLPGPELQRLGNAWQRSNTFWSTPNNYGASVHSPITGPWRRRWSAPDNYGASVDVSLYGSQDGQSPGGDWSLSFAAAPRGWQLKTCTRSRGID
jgi:hypothetical protein